MTRPARFVRQEKTLARLRWLAVLGWWYLLSASDAPVLWPAATVVLGLGLVYCGFSHYVAYRLSQGRPLSVPVPLLDTALVSLLCGVSGGVESPAFVYFYVISLAVGVRFGWTAGLCMAALQTLFCLEPLFLLSVPEAAAGLQLASLVLAGGIGAALSPSPESAQSVHQPLSLHATERLWDINHALSSLDIDTVMQQVVDALSRRLLPCEGVGLILLNRRSEQAERIAVGGGFAVPASTALAAGQAEGGLLRQVCDREPLVLDTQTSSQPKALGDLAEHSLLITPVMQPEYPQPLGCLLVADHAEGFSAETVGLLTAVARRTALAIENAQLYEALEKETRQLRGSAAYGHHHPGKRAQTSG